MPVKGKKTKRKPKSKSDIEEDGSQRGMFEHPQSNEIMQRMASKTLSSSARKLDYEKADMKDGRLLAETSQSSLWLSKTKFSVEDLLDSDDKTFGRLMNGEVRNDVFDCLTLDEVKDLKLVFDAFDASCTGTIDVIELRRILNALGFKVSEESLKRIIGSFDLEESGKVDFNDFLDIIISKQGSDRDIHSEMMQGFNFIDSDKSGKISLDNLRSVCRDHGLQLTDQELRDMIQEADLDGDGQVNPSEFVQIMQKTNLFK